jgi:hypothetical protein
MVIAIYHFMELVLLGSTRQNMLAEVRIGFGFEVLKYNNDYTMAIIPAIYHEYY